MSKCSSLVEEGNKLKIEYLRKILNDDEKKDLRIQDFILEMNNKFIALKLDALKTIFQKQTQNPEVTDDELREIMKEKFSISQSVIGQDGQSEESVEIKESLKSMNVLLAERQMGETGLKKFNEKVLDIIKRGESSSEGEC